MGFFDFLKPKPKVNVSITTHEPTKDEIAKQYADYCKAQAEKRHAEQEERANEYFLALSADDLADENGLKPTEILMLSYLEKYSSGKPVAKTMRLSIRKAEKTILFPRKRCKTM